MKQIMQKRGQISAQALLMILGGIIVVMVLIVGYGFISKAKKSADNTEFVQFKAKLTNDIKQMGTDYGSYKKVSFKVPLQVEQVCVADLMHKEEILDSKALQHFPLIEDSLESGAKQNIFYMGDVPKKSDYVEGIQMSHLPYFNCFKNVENKIEMGLEGKGGGTTDILAEFKTKATPSLTDEVELYSADDVFVLVLPAGLKDTSGNPIEEVSVEMVQPTQEQLAIGESDLYKFEPTNVQFVPPITMSIKLPSDAECPPTLPYTFVFGNQDENVDCDDVPTTNPQKLCYLQESVDCDNRRITFKISKII